MRHVDPATLAELRRACDIWAAADDGFPDEIVAAIARERGWASVLAGTMHLLSQLSDRKRWYYLGVVLRFIPWSGLALSEEGRAEVVAVMLQAEMSDEYWGMPDAGPIENLIWTVVTEMYGVRYESDWDFRADGAIRAALGRTPAPS